METCRGINFGGGIVLSEQRYPDATFSFISDIMKGWQKIDKVDSSRIRKENNKREEFLSINKSNIIPFPIF